MPNDWGFGNLAASKIWLVGEFNEATKGWPLAISVFSDAKTEPPLTGVYFFAYVAPSSLAFPHLSNAIFADCVTPFDHFFPKDAGPIQMVRVFFFPSSPLSILTY